MMEKAIENVRQKKWTPFSKKVEMQNNSTVSHSHATLSQASFFSSKQNKYNFVFLTLVALAFTFLFDWFSKHGQGYYTINFNYGTTYVTHFEVSSSFGNHKD